MEIKMHDIIVIGSSAGGVQALQELVKSFPKNMKASIFIVQHVAPDIVSYLPQILTSAGNLMAVHPKDGDPILQGRIYVAPPDHHMLLEGSRILIKRGPKENRFRPSVDALMRSAAYRYGSRVIGVVLTGYQNDGTSGLWSVRQCGGISIIQSPLSALYPDMPRNVLEYVEVDYSLPLSEIGQKINELVEQPALDKPDINEPDTNSLALKRMKVEIDAAAQKNTFEEGIMEMGEKSGLTCPECGGAMISIREGKTIRFRCHTGHGFSSAALFSGIKESVESSLWRAVRSIEEGVILFEQLATQSEINGNEEQIQDYYKQAADLRERSRALIAFIYAEGQI